MELDELKNAWTVWEERLKKNEMLKESIVKEMLQSKTTKSLNKLMNFDMFGMALLFASIPFLLFVLHHEARLLETHPVHRFTIIGALILVIMGCFAQVWSIYTLMRIDLSKAINNNIAFIQRYSIYIHWEKIGIAIFLLVLFAVCVIIYITEERIETWRLVAVICGLFFAVMVCIWQYKKIYDANIQTIQKSLEELKALKEE